MQVILLERIAKLGQMGDVVDVKPGYARNFLLPQGKAKSASEANIAAFKSEKAKLEAHNLETKKEADALAANLNGQNFIVIRSASDTGALYGSVTTRDAADAAKEAGFDINRKQFVLVSPIKELGLHQIEIRLHPEVSALVMVNVARSPEEAELQASGKTIQDVQAEQDQEAEFEIAELFDDIGSAALDDENLLVDEQPEVEEPEESSTKTADDTKTE